MDVTIKSAERYRADMSEEDKKAEEEEQKKLEEEQKKAEEEKKKAEEEQKKQEEEQKKIQEEEAKKQAESQNQSDSPVLINRCLIGRQGGDGFLRDLHEQVLRLHDEVQLLF